MNKSTINNCPFSKLGYEYNPSASPFVIFFLFVHPFHFPFLIKSVFIKMMIILHIHFTKHTVCYGTASSLPCPFVAAQRDRAAFFNVFYGQSVVQNGF